MTTDYTQTLAFQLLQKFEDYKAEIERLSVIVELCPIPVFIAGADGTILYVNTAYTETFGRDLAGVQNGAWITIFHPEERENIMRSWLDFLKNRQPKIVYTRYICPETGQTKKVRASAVPVPNDGVVGFMLPESCWSMVSPAGLSPAT